MVPSNSRNAQIKLSLGLLLTCVAVLGIILVRIKMQRDVVENRAKYNLQSWIAHGMKGYSEFQGNGRMIPQAICDKDGKPLLSWRVALLPYIEETSRFGQFALDEPWDSPHNIKMLAAMPSKYESPRKNGKPGETFYQVFTGPGTAFPKSGQGKLPRFSDCADQLLVVEALNGVPWTKPDDLPYDAQKPLPPLGGVFGEGKFFGVFGDQSVRWFSSPSERQLRECITGRK